MLAGGPAAGQTLLSGSISGAVLEQQVDAGTGVAQFRGPVEGGEVVLERARWSFSAGGRVGTLTARGADGADRDVAELGVAARFAAAAWLALQGGVTRRSYTTMLARQLWTVVHVGAEARLAFPGTGMSGVVGAALLPVVSVEGLQTPDVAFSAGAGMEYRLDHLVVGLAYSLERYDFPEQVAGRRLEQVSALTLRVGLRAGR